MAGARHFKRGPAMSDRRTEFAFGANPSAPSTEQLSFAGSLTLPLETTRENSVRKGGRGESPEPLSGRCGTRGKKRPGGPANVRRKGTRSGLLRTSPSQPAAPGFSAPPPAGFGENSSCLVCHGSGFIEVSRIGHLAVMRRCECRRRKRNGVLLGTGGAARIRKSQRVPDFKSQAAGERE